MNKSEIRHKQWEIGDSLFSSLKNGKVLIGHVSDIIRICDIKADGNAVGKFLQRARSMPHMPFLIERTNLRGAPYHQCLYRITLKNTSRVVVKTVPHPGSIMGS